MVSSCEIMDSGHGCCHKSSDVLQAYERGTTLSQNMMT
jgi:hypothetical protein